MAHRCICGVFVAMTVTTAALAQDPANYPNRPLRLIVPGWEGAYSVKWLNQLTVLTKDTDSFWFVTGYRYPNKRVAPGAAVDAKDMEPLKGLAVKSLITAPAHNASLAAGKVAVAGFAWAG